MQHPAFRSIPRILLFSGASLLAGLFIAFGQVGLIAVPPPVLIADALIAALLFAGLHTLLWYIVQYANLAGDNPLQRIINHTALLVLTLTCWVGMDFWVITLCFPKEIANEMTRGIPLKAVLGTTIFLIGLRVLIDQSNLAKQDEETDEQKKPDPRKPGVEEVNENPAPMVKSLEKITIKTGQKIHVIDIANVYFLQAEGDYVSIHTASGRYMKEQTMKHFEETLPSTRFVRIHRSAIINIEVVSRIELYEKQRYWVTLKSGDRLKTSTLGYKQLKKILQL